MQSIFVIAVFGCLAVSLCQEPCPVPDVQYTDFDLSKVAGAWLVTYRFPNPLQQNCTCDSLYVTENTESSGAILTGGCYDTVTKKVGLQHAFVENIDVKGKFEVKTLDGDGNTISLPFYLAATDYDTYAVLYSCSQYGEYAEVLSRNGVTDPEVKSAIDAEMQEHGVDFSKFVPITQDCYNF